MFHIKTSTLQIKWLVPIWNVTLSWNGFKGNYFTPFKHVQTCHVPRPKKVQKSLMGELHLNSFTRCTSQTTDMGSFLKGYLRYKTITSQNVSLRHRLRIFLFRRKVMFRSQDIEVFVFLTIPTFTKSVTSWWVLVHETRCTFDYIFWITTN